MYNLETLVGCTIEQYTISEEGSRIRFFCRDGKIVTFGVEAGCCSTTWIESIDQPDVLIGTVTAVEDIEMPDLGDIDGKRHVDVHIVKYYGLKITTEHGSAVLDYRNDSNGYYGGNLYLEENDTHEELNWHYNC